MAYLPCDAGTHFHPARNVNVYTGVLGDGPDLRKTARLCQGHWGEVEPHLSEHEIVPDDLAGGGNLTVKPCPACKQPLHQLQVRAFVTAYPAKDDRKDYWLNLHQNCDKPSWLRQLLAWSR